MPDYQLSSGGDQIQAGVIMNNPSYSSFQANQPPAAFSSVSGIVGLDPSQVNAQGNLPSGFDQPGFKFNISPSQQDYHSETELQLPTIQDNNQALLTEGGYHPPNA